MKKPGPQPFYTMNNVSWAPSLYFTVTVYWRCVPPPEASWYPVLKTELAEKDGIVLRGHDHPAEQESRFFIEASPEHAPSFILQRVKGRLQHLVRSMHPKAFQRNYFLRSVGRTKQDKVEGYLRKQLAHHPMADERVVEMFEAYQFEDADLCLSSIRASSHGRFQYNLHFVLVNDQRWREIREEPICRYRDGVIGIARKKSHLLKAVGLLPDHCHVSLGADVGESPGEVVLGYMNNLAYVMGMKAIFQARVWVGTAGDYDIGAVKLAERAAPGAESWPHRDKPGGGRV